MIKNIVRKGNPFFIQHNCFFFVALNEERVAIVKYILIISFYEIESFDILDLDNSVIEGRLHKVMKAI